MALSYLTYTGNGSNKLFTAPPYLDASHISVLVNGVSVSFTWNNASVVETAVAPANGAAVVVKRVTEKTVRLVDYQAAALMKEEDLDTDSLQAFYLAQEAADELVDRLTLDADKANWDAGGKRITNVGTPTASGDAATKGWIESTYNSDLNAAVDAAEAARDKADQWANAGEDVPVELPNFYSAKHYSLKALDAQLASETAQADAETAQGLAEDARDKAEAWAENPEDVEVETGKYSALHHRAKAEDAQAAAEAAAAGVNLPSIVTGDAGKILAVKADETGFGLSSPAPANGDSLIYNGNLWVPTPSGKRNSIINGCFRCWQRGLSVTGLTGTSNRMLADRFRLHYNSGATFTMDQGTPPTVAQLGFKGLNALRVFPTVADTSIGAAEYANIAYTIEGYDTLGLIGRVVTLSFWVYATKTGIYTVSFRNGASDRSYVAEYTVNASNTWEKKTITLTMHDASSGTWDFINGAGLYVTWTIAAGSNYNTTKDQWVSGAYTSTANQVNALDAINNYFMLYGVQLEPGPIATPFEHRLFATEFALCQRYYEFGGPSYFVGDVTSGVVYFAFTTFKVTKRRTLLSGDCGITATVNSGFPATAPTFVAGGLDYLETSHTANATANGGYFGMNWVVNCDF